MWCGILYFKYLIIITKLQGKNLHDLKKQLRVQFVGEDGIDEGGIQKGISHRIKQNFFRFLDVKYFRLHLVR
jgi:hypothetical protein